MTTLNYASLGFRCGLEIHQQLETGKLFCRCLSIVHDEQPSITVQRRLRPVAGESGQIDPAALYEATKGRYFTYQACPTSSCLVELDEEPPHDLNQEALWVVLQAAKMMHARVVDEVRVMRKIVIDGSNVSGFQRTALVAMNGYIDTSKGRVGIPTICLEEESAQRIAETRESITYRLDRLGIPLIEVSTDTSIKDPEHAKEAAETIGMLLRSTGRVKRGIGTIRQDVNVSIAKGARTEIKGFQELKSIPAVIEHEIKRQLSSIQKQGTVAPEVRKAEANLTTTFLRPMPGAARMYPETDVASIPITPSLLASIPVPEPLRNQLDTLARHYNLDKDIAATLVNDGIAEIFRLAADSCKSLKPAYIADTLLSAPKQVKAKTGKDVHPSLHDWKDLFLAIDAGAISKESVVDILSTGRPLHEMLDSFKSLSDAELDHAIQDIIRHHKGLPINTLIGKVMGQLRGKADGKKIVERIKQLTGA